jgi:ribonuclease P protein component
MRFRPEQHLRRQRDIRAVREQGRRIEGRLFTLWWHRRGEPMPGDSVPPPGARVCVIASTAAVGAATRRARAKRRLREVFRQNQSQVPSGCDLLFIARASAGDCPFGELSRRFQEACRQIPPSA